MLLVMLRQAAEMTLARAKPTDNQDSRRSAQEALCRGARRSSH
jgi:hypothetical protein